ncbi:MAG TPA: zinc-ribbon domain containing protein, partial [Ktedonobacterales bacterium]|nr:zinc-ribbon domain containing protein [Ktedonobacterales bacterium]
SRLTLSPHWRLRVTAFLNTDWQYLRKHGDIPMAADIVLTCRDCGRDFEFTVGEQEFYASRGLTNQPSRCPECRAARKGARSGGGYGGGSRGERQMYTVTCSSCGREAQVPFQPRGDRPVYCSDCYAQQSQRSRY